MRAAIASLGMAIAALLALTTSCDAQGRRPGRVDTVTVVVHDTVYVTRVDTVRITVTDTIVDTLVILLDSLTDTLSTNRTDTLLNRDTVRVTDSVYAEAPADSTDPDPPPVVIGVPQPEPDGNAELPRLWVNTAMTPTTRTVPVTSCGALQSALDNAEDGDRVALTAGLTCTGNWVLRGQHDPPVILTTATPLPDEGVRARPSTSGQYATLVARGVEPAIRTSGPVEGWRVMGLHVRPDTTHSVNWALIRIGTGAETSVDSQPRNVILDRLYITAHDSIDIQRCIAIEGRYIAVVNSWVAGCHYKGADAQAVISWNSVGPHAIRNNRLEGSGENIMWGGADPKIPGAVACDLDIRGNHFVKPDAWYDRNGSNPYTEKNLFELKNSCRVLIEGNVFEGNWGDGQTGFAVVLKSSNQSGRCDWCVTHDVTMRWNWIKDSPGGVSFHRLDDYSGGGGIPMHHVTYANNLHTGFQTYDGSRRLWQITGSQQIRILRNTGTDPGLSNAVMMDGTPSQGSAIRDNLIARGNYGIFGSGRGEGTNAINYFLPGGEVTGNVLVGTTCAGFVYPAGNTCVTTIPTTTTAGVDQAELMRRLEGVVVAP